MNWEIDEWFAKHHAHNLDDEFKAFWILFYGEPLDYAGSEDEQHEYWVRCAFTLTGWKARDEKFLVDIKKLDKKYSKV